MRIVLATSNKGKMREIKHMLEDLDVHNYTDLIPPFEIVEDADTFKENALIKARAVYEALDDEDTVVIADDSGISVDALKGGPGVFSARFAGENATDKNNLEKLIDELKKKSLSSSKAYYTAAIAIVSKEGEQTVHGWMHGTVISQARGQNGFGYDPIFIPEEFDKTLGELDDELKKELSHRSQALTLAKILLNQIRKQR